MIDIDTAFDIFIKGIHFYEYTNAVLSVHTSTVQHCTNHSITAHKNQVIAKNIASYRVSGLPRAHLDLQLMRLRNNREENVLPYHQKNQQKAYIHSASDISFYTQL